RGDSPQFVRHSWHDRVRALERGNGETEEEPMERIGIDRPLTDETATAFHHALAVSKLELGVQRIGRIGPRGRSVFLHLSGNRTVGRRRTAEPPPSGPALRHWFLQPE